MGKGRWGRVSTLSVAHVNRFIRKDKEGGRKVRGNVASQKGVQKVRAKDRRGSHRQTECPLFRPKALSRSQEAEKGNQRKGRDSEE